MTATALPAVLWAWGIIIVIGLIGLGFNHRGPKPRV